MFGKLFCDWVKAWLRKQRQLTSIHVLWKYSARILCDGGNGSENGGSGCRTFRRCHQTCWEPQCYGCFYVWPAGLLSSRWWSEWLLLVVRKRKRRALLALLATIYSSFLLLAFSHEQVLHRCSSTSSFSSHRENTSVRTVPEKERESSHSVKVVAREVSGYQMHEWSQSVSGGSGVIG